MAQRPGPPSLPPRKPAPPLPPRKLNTQQSPYSDLPPTYDSVLGRDSDPPFEAAEHDPRSSSTQSLVPSVSDHQRERRKLLLIYIHGFMGDETSFQSFPAHVHNLVTTLVSDSHVVHTKIYPRYRSKKQITFARDDFSRWYNPFSNQT
jgi:hypothetical protein